MSIEVKEYIDKASKANIEDNYDTTYQTCIELSKKMIELEERLKKMEEVKS